MNTPKIIFERHGNRSELWSLDHEQMGWTDADVDSAVTMETLADLQDRGYVNIETSTKLLRGGIEYAEYNIADLLADGYYDFDATYHDGAPTDVR